MFDNDDKNRVREMSLSHLPGAPFSSYFTLPGENALDLRFMLENGVVEPSSSGVLIENKSEHIANIARSRDALVANGDLSPGATRIILRDVERYVPDTKFDLMNFDMMTSMTPDLGLSLERRFAQAMNDGAVVIITLVDGTRGCPFVIWFMDVVGDRYPLELSEIVDYFSEYDPSPTSYQIAMAFLIQSAFSGYRFENMALLPYGGSGTHFGMVTYRLETLRKSGPSTWPTFSQIHDMYINEVPPQKRDRVGLTEKTDERGRFNRLLAQDNLILVREDGREVLYHYRWNLFRTGTVFKNVREARKAMKGE